MLSRTLSYVGVWVGAAMMASACSSSDAATVQAAGAGGADAGDAGEGSAGTGGVVEAGPEAASDQHSDDCTPGEGRCAGSTPQQCNQERNWEPCPSCAFLDTDSLNCGACGNDCKALPCSGAKCVAITELASPGGDALAVDATTLYWLANSWDDDAGVATRSVMKSGLNGESPVKLWHGSAGHAFAVSTTAMYWSIGIYDEGKNGWVAGLLKLSLNGGAVETVTTSPWSPASIAVDANAVYWTSGNRVAKADQQSGDPVQLVAGAWVGTAIAVDSSYVYWTDQGTDNVPGAVLKVPLTGGAATVLASAQSWPHAIAVDATSVYWLTWDTLMKLDKNGGQPVVLASTPNADEGQLALDDTSVYWTTNGGGGPYPNGTVRKVPLEGGTVKTLAAGQPIPMGIKVDATNVYWVTSEAVMRVAK